MIAIDTNILVYGHRSDAPFHERAFRVLKEVAEGDAFHDARIAGICVAHGVDELWSADRDFNRFTGLCVKNPLIER